MSASREIARRLFGCMSLNIGGDGSQAVEIIASYVEEAITAEREACAKIADEYAKEIGETGVLPRIVAAIRARTDNT